MDALDNGMHASTVALIYTSIYVQHFVQVFVRKEFRNFVSNWKKLCQKRKQEKKDKNKIQINQLRTCLSLIMTNYNPALNYSHRK